jgi:hypothetical protein
MSSETEKIENIIKNISKTEIKTFAQIKELNREAVEDIFSDFIDYPRNNDNKEEALEKLADYQLIKYSDLYKGDNVAYLNKKEFWNIKIITGRVIGMNKNGHYSVKIGYNKTVYVLPEYIFRKLTDDEKFKLQLIEAVYTL